MSLSDVTIGFLPLMDAALLIIAEERGFAANEGLHLNLVRETSWANIRDRLVVGHFDVAHMLAPMPIASNLGLNPVNAPMIAPMALGLGGNAVTVGAALWAQMAGEGASADLDAGRAGAALRRVVAGRTAAPLRFGVVHPYSGHNYELRYWLAASGVRPDIDVEIVIVPPPLLPDALAQGSLDGFCVGEPWNSVAVAQGAAVLATAKSSIWRSSPEKVLGMTTKWAETQEPVLAALLAALYRASEWLGRDENLMEAARILSGPRYLAQPAELVQAGLSGKLALGGAASAAVSDFFVPNARAATFPWQSHALWFYSQMVRWGQVAHSAQNARLAQDSYRPDIYRKLVGALGVPVPAANSKVEGALAQAHPVGVNRGKLMIGPDGFFDGRIFDPLELDAYIRGQNLDVMQNN